MVLYGAVTGVSNANSSRHSDYVPATNPYYGKNATVEFTAKNTHPIPSRSTPPHRQTLVELHCSRCSDGRLASSPPFAAFSTPHPPPNRHLHHLLGIRRRPPLLPCSRRLPHLLPPAASILSPSLREPPAAILPAAFRPGAVAANPIFPDRHPAGAVPFSVRRHLPRHRQPDEVNVLSEPPVEQVPVLTNVLIFSSHKCQHSIFAFASMRKI
ncbi:hypothetical protein BRADI_2g20732v3 [Brachypodium distachyon]|uniref:Uncharacterized protein n=1 Tax=Brachypodium distachyon TaxID=15368 RepID=A0A2K2D9L7_BRADI|nr:hypothetical protein BRADI_2g20732v3 [Brachypodium distachyon]